MCIACTLEKGSHITEAEFTKCWRNNPDGGGFAMLDEDGNWIIEKSMDFEEFKGMFSSRWEERREYSPCLLHFRMGTSGTKDETNCHPFLINKNVAMIHNGVITGLTYKDNKKSDTNTFCTDLLKDLPMNFCRNESMMAMIQQIVGKSNKLAFLERSSGKFYYTNGDQGIFQNDSKLGRRWWSNNSFQDYRTTSRFASGSQGYFDYQVGKHLTWEEIKSSNAAERCNRMCTTCAKLVRTKDFNTTDSTCNECEAFFKKLAEKTAFFMVDIRKAYKTVAEPIIKAELTDFSDFYKSQGGQTSEIFNFWRGDPFPPAQEKELVSAHEYYAGGFYPGM